MTDVRSLKGKILTFSKVREKILPALDKASMHLSEQLIIFQSYQKKLAVVQSLSMHQL